MLRPRIAWRKRQPFQILDSLPVTQRRRESAEYRTAFSASPCLCVSVLNQTPIHDNISLMKFSLRTLLLVTTVIPPLIWWIATTIAAVVRRDPEHPVQWPEPILLIGVIGWWAIFYSFIHKRPAGNV